MVVRGGVWPCLAISADTVPRLLERLICTLAGCTSGFHGNGRAVQEDGCSRCGWQRADGEAAAPRRPRRALLPHAPLPGRSWALPAPARFAAGDAIFRR